VGCSGSLTGMCSSLAVTMAELRIALLPPELVTDHNNVKRSRRSCLTFGRIDYSCRGKKEHKHDENRNHQGYLFGYDSYFNFTVEHAGYLYMSASMGPFQRPKSGGLEPTVLERHTSTIGGAAGRRV
jgi:hypothetical protein